MSQFPHSARGESFPNRTQVWNSLVDAARSNDSPPATQPPSATLRTDPSVILVKNNSGADVATFGVLGLGDVQITEATNSKQFLSEVYMDGERPEPGTHSNRFAVVTEPIPNGKIGKAVVHGLVQCQVTMHETWHEYADVAYQDRTVLDSAPSASARILWVAGTTGTQWAIVHVGGPLPQPTYAALTGHGTSGVEAEEYAATSSGGATGSSLAATGRTFDAAGMGELGVIGMAGARISTFPIPATVTDPIAFATNPVRWARANSADATWSPYIASPYADDAVFAVTMVKTSGSSGHAGAQCSFVYDIQDAAGNVLRSGFDPNAALGDSDYFRASVGSMTQATAGLARINTLAFTIHLVWCNEVFDMNVETVVAASGTPDTLVDIVTPV